MEFIHLFNLTVIFVFVGVKFFKAYVEHDNVSFKKEKKTSIYTDDMIEFK